MTRADAPTSGTEESRQTREEAAPRPRLAAIDALRGLVIVLMALDHVRDFWSEARFSPTDLSRTTPALFLTRVVTHLCAPTFVLLAGLSAYLLSQQTSTQALRRFLLSRGVWLILLEYTVVRFVWSFDLGYTQGVYLQVIWVIGISMCVLAALVSLPLWLITLLSLITIVGHNAFDHVSPEELGVWSIAWRLLHVQGPTPLGYVYYPLVPWPALMAAGFVFGHLYVRSEDRSQLAIRWAALLLVAFIVLRAINVYGDPVPWQAQGSTLRTALSFVDVSKYPPSLAFVLLTLGVALLVLALFERWAPAALVVFGRVPLFAYVVHIALAHLLAGLSALALGHGPGVLTDALGSYPAGWGFGLRVVYAVWLLVLALLYPACVWFAGVKQRSRASWVRYL
jgi:uncharacterized membrane protein